MAASPNLTRPGCSRDTWLLFLKRPATWVVGLFVFVVLAFAILLFRYSILIDRRFESGSFQSVSEVYAAPRPLHINESLTPAELVAQLRRSGYAENASAAQGRYVRRRDGIEITPGPGSDFLPEPVLIAFARGHVARIVSLNDNRPHDEVLLEPELISNLIDKSRTKRRLVHFAEIPVVLQQAVTSTEDKRFFQHTGFDVRRIAKAAYVDLREGRKEQGASTLIMQLARNVFLDSDKSWNRKMREAFLTFLLEARFSKQQLFEYYANEVYLGQKGTFSIHGFGEAARDYFGKEVSQLTLPEAALLAGTIQRPSYFNPFRWPDRAIARRQIVLTLMRQNGYIDAAQFSAAAAAPLRLAPASSESRDAPYFLDLVNTELPAQIQDHDIHMAHRIYTSLDLNLQREAANAVAFGMKLVDAQVRRAKRAPTADKAVPQVALIALDISTGAIKALIGGRDYNASQLNHVLAKRQPGSVFKPFDYAAAMTPVTGKPAVTAATLIQDEPTTFTYQNQSYSPSNFRDQFHGTVTVRAALAESLNIPAVKVAELAGYDAVANLARGAGLDVPASATPAMALGAYETTPLDIAGAYTLFARQGIEIKPNWIARIRDRSGAVVFDIHPEEHKVLDPRVAYLITNLMEEVLRTGTGAGVRAQGFTLPAAGKTGTSRDGWFAGFTSKLLCVVWVGYDDNRELNLEGAKSALPIWTEFMKRAHGYPEYSDAHEFVEPAGMVHASIDPQSGQLATELCPNVRSEVFIAGTTPTQPCPLHQAPESAAKSFFKKLFRIFK